MRRFSPFSAVNFTCSLGEVETGRALSLPQFGGKWYENIFAPQTNVSLFFVPLHDFIVKFNRYG